MNAKYLTIMCLIVINCRIAKTTDSSEEKEKQADDVENWSNSLIPATVSKWNELIYCPAEEDQLILKNVLMASGCPTEILDALIANADKDKWPPGLLTGNEINCIQIDKYNCKRIFGHEYLEFLIVLSSDNKEMEITEPGFVIIFFEGSLRPKGADDVEEWSDSLLPATVFKWDNLVYKPIEQDQNHIREELIASMCPPQILDALIANADMSRWPPGLSTRNEFNRNRSQIDNYNCKSIFGHEYYEILIVLSSDNKEIEIAEPGFIMIFFGGALKSKVDDKGALDRRIKEYSESLLPVKGVDWELLIYTPEKDAIDKIKYGLIRSKCPTQIWDALIENAQIEAWPSCLHDTINHGRFDTAVQCRCYEKYTIKLIPTHDILFEAAIVFSFDNKCGCNPVVVPGIIILFLIGGIKK